MSVRLKPGKARSNRSLGLTVPGAQLVRRGRVAPRLRDLVRGGGLPLRREVGMGSLAGAGIALVRAPNPGPFTLDGTNTWIVGRDPAYVSIPARRCRPRRRVLRELTARGGLGGIALTHDHADHAEAVAAVRERSGGAGRRWPGPRRRRRSRRRRPLRAARGSRDARPRARPPRLSWPAARPSPATPCWARAACSSTPTAAVWRLPRRPACATGRASSPCCAPATGRRSGTPAAKLDEYVAHRLDRERRLLEALADGAARRGRAARPRVVRRAAGPAARGGRHAARPPAQAGATKAGSRDLAGAVRARRWRPRRRRVAVLHFRRRGGGRVGPEGGGSRPRPSSWPPDARRVPAGARHRRRRPGSGRSRRRAAVGSRRRGCRPVASRRSRWGSRSRARSRQRRRPA